MAVPRNYYLDGTDVPDSRQFTAFMLLLFLAICVPVLVAVVLAFMTFSLWATGLDHHAHEHLWGWLTDWSNHTDSQGHVHRVASPNRVPLVYFVGTVWAYIAYQICELAAYPIRRYRRLVRRRKRVQEMYPGHVREG